MCCRRGQCSGGHCALRVGGPALPSLAIATGVPKTCGAGRDGLPIFCEHTQTPRSRTRGAFAHHSLLHAACRVPGCHAQRPLCAPLQRNTALSLMRRRAGPGGGGPSGAQAKAKPALGKGASLNTLALHPGTSQARHPPCAPKATAAVSKRCGATLPAASQSIASVLPPLLNA